MLRFGAQIAKISDRRKYLLYGNLPIYSKHLLDSVVLLTLFVNLCRYSARTIDALQRMDLDMKELDLDLIHNLIRHIVFREDVSTYNIVLQGWGLELIHNLIRHIVFREDMST